MEKLIVKIKNKNKIDFTRELLSSFSFLEIETEKKKPGLSESRKRALLQGFKELKKVEAGKLKAKPATTLLKELRNGKH